MSTIVLSQICLWAVMCVLALLVVALARQVGVLHERIAPAGALTLHRKVRPGDLAPTLTVDDISGRPVTIGGDRKAHQLILFLSPDCPVCKTLLPILQSSAQAEAEWVEFIIASDGPLPTHRSFAELPELRRFPYVVSQTLGTTFDVAKLPYGVLLDPSGRVLSLGLVNTREHLESLFVAKERGVDSLQTFLSTG